MHPTEPVAHRVRVAVQEGADLGDRPLVVKVGVQRLEQDAPVFRCEREDRPEQITI